jgi:uncharacterized protein
MPLLKYRKEIERVERKKRLTLTLLTTDRCNLNCSYCYERSSERKKGNMKFSTAKDAISYYMERDDGLETVSIEFFGGEPLLAFGLIKKTVEWFLSRKWKKKAYFSLITNGTILTKEMREWLPRYSKTITVAFTVDGCKEAHDLNRCQSYDLVKKNIPFFIKYWPQQPTKFSVNEKTIPYIAKSVIHLENMKINFNGGIVLEDIWGDGRKKKLLLEKFEEQLTILVDFYKNRPELYPSPPLFPIIPDYLGMPDSNADRLKKEQEIVRFCGAGFEMITIDVNGKRYPCHRFLPLCAGKPIPKMPVNRQIRWKPETCEKCKLISSCPTCAGFNYQINGDTSIRSTFHCEAYKLSLQASCKFEAIRLMNMKASDLKKLSNEEKKYYKRKLDVIINIIENGI